MEFLALAAWTALVVLAVRPRNPAPAGTKEEEAGEDHRDLLGVAVLIPTLVFAMSGWAWIIQNVVQEVAR